MKRPQGTTFRSVNDIRARLAIEYVKVQVMTMDFLAESDQKEPSKDQADTGAQIRIQHLFYSQLENRFFLLGSPATQAKISIDAKARYERVFQVACQLPEKWAGRANELGIAIGGDPYLPVMAHLV